MAMTLGRLIRKSKLRSVNTFLRIAGRRTLLGSSPRGAIGHRHLARLIGQQYLEQEEQDDEANPNYSCIASTGERVLRSINPDSAYSYTVAVDPSTLDIVSRLTKPGQTTFSSSTMQSTENAPIYISASNIFQAYVSEEVRRMKGSVVADSLEFFSNKTLFDEVFTVKYKVFSLTNNRAAVTITNPKDSEEVVAVLEAGTSGSSLNVDIVALRDGNWLDYVTGLFSGFKEIKSQLEWIYSDNGNSITIPLTDDKKPIKEFYPFLGDKTLEEYYDEFMASDASVLLLIGPPGTAKTSFIRGLIQYTEKSGLVTYDPAILSRDSFFAGFVEGASTFLIMEDADTFLRSRKEENNMMFKFLNVSSGLITVTGKKLIFSTNLPSIKDVDEALIRPGRCHDVLEFSKLNSKQADSVREKFGIEKTGQAGTVAEILNQKAAPTLKSSKSTMGFV